MKPAVSANSPRWLREYAACILLIVFFALVLVSRFTISPRRWRYVQPGMTTQEFVRRLGTPALQTSNELRWREKRLLSHWELVAVCESGHVKKVDTRFRWFLNSAP